VVEAAMAEVGLDGNQAMDLLYRFIAGEALPASSAVMIRFRDFVEREVAAIKAAEAAGDPADFRVAVDPDLAAFILAMAACNGIAPEKYANNLIEIGVAREREASRLRTAAAGDDAPRDEDEED
jgi:hypothetical protein